MSVSGRDPVRPLSVNPPLFPVLQLSWAIASLGLLLLFRASRHLSMLEAKAGSLAWLVRLRAPAWW